MRKALLTVPLIAVVFAAPALADTTTVTASGPGTNWYTADTRGTGSAEFTTVGDRGAVKVSTHSTGDKAQLLTDLYDGMALNELTELSYTTYRDSSSTGFEAGVTAINLVVDAKGADGLKGNDGIGDTYVVYEPYQDEGNAAVVSDVWQTWHPITAAQDATWWINTGAGGCGQGPTCTWAQVLEILDGGKLAAETAKANGTLTGFQGSLGLNQGSNNAGIITGVDSLTVNGTTYDFGPKVFTKDDCKGGGWADAGHGPFKNQGACVSFYAKA